MIFTDMLQQEELSVEEIEQGIENIFIKSFGDLFYTFAQKSECQEIANKLYEIVKFHQVGRSAHK